MTKKQFDSALAAVYAPILAKLTTTKCKQGKATISIIARTHYPLNEQGYRFSQLLPLSSIKPNKPVPDSWKIEEEGVMIIKRETDGYTYTLIPYEEITGIQASIKGSIAGY